MSPTQRRADTRDRILDAAYEVMRAKGLARSTTKEIARAAGCSEANLYKYFESKDRLMVTLFTERLPSLSGLLARLNATPGEGDLRANLELVARTALAFYREAVPMVGAIFADPNLVANLRDTNLPAGRGPWIPVVKLTAYLRAEQELGRYEQGADPEAVASLLLGACTQQAFIDVMRGTTERTDDAEQAARLVAMLPNGGGK